MIKKLSMLFAAALLAGCATTPPPLVSSETLIVVDATELPMPTDADPSRYLIGASDRLIIDVFGFQELNARRLQVDGNGRIDVPIAGSVQVAGLTPAQAADAIEQRLRAGFVRAPQVAVNLEEALSRYVTVDGQVTIPGNYPVNGDMSLIRAVAAARGLSEFARLEDVVVFRTVNGQRMVALYNLAAIRRGVYADPRLYPSDIVVVGNSSARRLFRDLLTTVPLLLSPIIGVLANSNSNGNSNTTTPTTTN